MSVEDDKKDLEQQGVTPGSWTEIPDRILPGATMGQIEALTKLRELLEEMKAKDQKTIAQLREQLARIRHGGGS